MQSHEVDTVYKQYCNLVMSTAYTWVNDYELAQDICQDVFVKLYMRADKIQEDRVKGWLLVVTEHEAVNYLRSNGKISLVSMSERDIQDEIDEVSETDKEEKDFERCEFRRRIFRDLYRKNPIWYEIVIRLTIYKEEPRQVAKSINMTYAHMRTILSRARAWIRKNYGEEYAEMR